MNCHRPASATIDLRSMDKKVGILYRMNGKPKRPWFQIHLSTAIVLMFVASGLMWANFSVNNAELLRKIDKENQQRQSASKKYINPFYHDQMIPFDFAQKECGWPITAYFCESQIIILAPEWRLVGVMVDATVALVLLISIAVGSERLVRRREARKP